MSFFISGRRIMARETLTVSTAVKTLTAATYGDQSATASTGNQVTSNRRHAIAATITCETQAIRVTTDGTTPVAATTGIKMNVGDTMVLDSYQELVNFKAVRDGASDGTIQVNYYRSI